MAFRRKFYFSIRALTVAFVVASHSHAISTASASAFVRMDFNLTLQSRSRDTVFIELFDDRPLTRDNFLQYVNGGHYDNSLIHRLARNFVLQGGGFYPELQDEAPPLNVSIDPSARVDLDGNPLTANPTVNNEFTNSPFRSNLRGTLAMAKVGGNANSATSEFFFNLGNNAANLDNQNGGFTVFAQVVGDGMTLIDAFNGLGITNLNPDADNDGFRDAGPFYNTSSDGTPFLGSSLLTIDDAERIDYYGPGSTTNIPAGGLAIGSRDAFIDTGAAFTGTGALTIAVGRELGVREGIVLARQVVNHGTLAPGLQLGSITAQSYQQSATGKLEIQLRVTDAATPDSQEFDNLTVTGAAQLAGTLDVSLLAGYMPTAGSSFAVLNASSITGSFTAFNLPTITAGLSWLVDQTATAVTLSVVAPDYNLDGLVNGNDLGVWKNLFGQTGSNLAADGNKDGVVDGSDFLVWQRTLGRNVGTPPPISAVPEPAAAALALFAAAACGLARRSGRPLTGAC